MPCIRNKRIGTLFHSCPFKTITTPSISHAKFVYVFNKKMAQSTKPSFASESDIWSFQKHLFHSKRILALCGAGLSAASGLPTFRGAGGMWKNHEATTLATPEAFEEDPGLVWQFYAYRRHTALQAQPNPAHFALAALAKKKTEFACLSQNVDGMLKILFRYPCFIGSSCTILIKR